MIHNANFMEILYDKIQIVMWCLPQNFAHATAAQLLWHVQNFVAILPGINAKTIKVNACDLISNDSLDTDYSLCKYSAIWP